MIRRLAVRARLILGLAGAQLLYYRGRTLLAALGVALAVLLMALMAGLGYGATSAGADALAWIDRDLWMTPGALEFAPTAVGGIETRLSEAHTVTREVAAREGVASAGALSFQAVYVGANGSEFTTVVGVGATDTGTESGLNVRSGPGFSTGDRHYANGSYDGNWSGEVVIDERTAALLNASVGDRIHVGGTIANAREHAFEVVGISPTFSTFLGTATVTLHLSELQELTGSTANDPASLVAITTAGGSDPEAVEADLEAEYGYEVRTNREQLRAFVGGNAGVVVGATALSIVAVVAGIALVVNVLGTLVAHQRRELAALRAVGMSGSTLVGAVLCQGLGIGLLGSVVGVGIVPPAASALNRIVGDLTGFGQLVKTPAWILAGGAGLAFTMGLFGAAVAAWSALRTEPLVHLREEG
jgi:putative ABC transport system permease protein